VTPVINAMTVDVEDYFRFPGARPRNRVMRPRGRLRWLSSPADLHLDAVAIQSGRPVRSRARELHWEYELVTEREMPDVSPANPKFQLAIAVWQTLPLALTMRVGPLIVRAIP
jgi:hypothetical protein